MTTLHFFMDCPQHRTFLRFGIVSYLVLLALPTAPGAAVPASPGGQDTSKPPAEQPRPNQLGPAKPAGTRTVNAETSLSIKADSQEKDKDTFRLRGHVEVLFHDMKLTADEATYNAASGEVMARGHISFTDPHAHLEADEAHYNLRTLRGRFLNAYGYVRTPVRPRPRMLVTENPFFIRAKTVERLDRETFTVEGARLTTCECEKTGWSLGVHSARVIAGDKVISRGAVFRFLRLPLLYAPVFVNSIAPRPRQSGFLIPHIGNSSQKGTILGEGIFWALNPSADLLMGIENYSIRGVGGRGRFRARPSETSDINVDYFGVNDRGSGPNRQSRAPGQTIRAIGQASDLGYGFRGVLDVDYITSLAFRQTFTDNFTQAVTSEVHQTGFVTKNFDAYSVNIYASRYQNFLCAQPFLGNVFQNQNCPTTTGLPRNTISIRQTPSFSMTGLDKQVGKSPFYFSFESSAAGVGRAEPGFETPRLSERVDLSPQVTLRLKPFWGLHLTPSAGVHATHYGTSLTKGRDALNRLLGEISLDLRPPAFDKVFSKPVRGYRFKHVMEPEIRYRLVRGPGGQDLTDIVRFDQLDIFAQTNEFEYSLTNSLIARKDVAEGAGEKPQAHELLSLRLSQKYYFDPTFGGVLVPGQKVVFEPTISLTGFAFAQGRRLSPLVSVLKFAPSSNYDTELRADIDPGGGDVLNAGVTSHVRRGPLGVAVTDFFVNRTAELTQLVPLGTNLAQLPSFNLLRVVATYGEISRKGFSSAVGLDYNFSQGIAHQVVSQASYNFGCFALDFEYRRFALGTLRRENQYRVALSLANVGTFGNLKPRERLY